MHLLSCIIQINVMNVFTFSVSEIYSINASNKRSFNKFSEWAANNFFLLKDQDDKVIAAIKCNIVVENEEVNELSHWPQSTGCTDCAFDSRKLKDDLQKIDWGKLKNGIPPSVVCVY